VTLVVDASVAALWVLDQEDSVRANSLRGEDRLIAPSLIVAEIGSAIWKAVRRGEVSRADAVVALRAALRPLDALIAIEGFHIRALEFATAFNHPIYDCFYIALAQRENTPLITADEHQLAAARKAKVKVRRL
jgi:predicted nucleic acid-binding protein